MTALDADVAAYIEHQLFSVDLDPDFARRIQQAAQEQLEECQAMREARG